jgi:hypothetical protein
VTQAASDLAFCVTDAILLLATTWRDRVTQVRQRRKIAGLSPATVVTSQGRFSVMVATHASSQCAHRNITAAWPGNPHELPFRANMPGPIGVFPVRLVLSGPRRSGHFL